MYQIPKVTNLVSAEVNLRILVTLNNELNRMDQLQRET
jgi:hypothetical protein